MQPRRLQKLKDLIVSYQVILSQLTTNKTLIKNRVLVPPKSVKIAEMGPRDGLQNEKTILDTEFKIEMINRLSETGLDYIESTSFVSPKWVPQMGDNVEVYSKINKKPGVTYSALVPNARGMQSALGVDCQEIAVFTGASEGFVKKNINCTIVGK